MNYFNYKVSAPFKSRIPTDVPTDIPTGPTLTPTDRPTYSPGYNIILMDYNYSRNNYIIVCIYNMLVLLVSRHLSLFQ
jgi:hypothetical protein